MQDFKNYLHKMVKSWFRAGEQWDEQLALRSPPALASDCCGQRRGKARSLTGEGFVT